jgi:hypothetical protein
MASFGYGVGDAVALGQVAWNVVRNARAACGEHDELTREVCSLHVVLKRLEQEGSNTESLINKPDNAQELHGIVKGCEKVLKILDDILQKYNSLGEDEKKVKKLWKRIRFGNGEMQDLGQLRAKVSYYTSAISLFLNMLTVGSLGKVEQQMNSAGDELREIRIAVNGITAHLLSNHREGSVLTNYDDDDKAVWKAFRRELVSEGFSSTIIHKHKRLIKAYVRELGNRGLLDDPVEDESGSVPKPTAANDHQGTQRGGTEQNILPNGETGCIEKAGIAEDQQNGEVTYENRPSSDIEQENTPNYPPMASVESETDEDDMPRIDPSGKDSELILEGNILDDISSVGENEVTASHIVPSEHKHHTTTERTSLVQPLVQKVTETTIRRQLTSYTAYDIRKIQHACSKTACTSAKYCTKCDSSRSSWINQYIEPLNISTKVLDLTNGKFFAQGPDPVVSTSSQQIRDRNWGRAYITRLDFTPEQLRLETTHGNRRPLEETKQALSPNQQGQIEHLLKDLNSNERHPIFEWQLAQLRLRFDVYSDMISLIVTVQRAPRERGVSTESLYQVYAQQFPDGLPQQIRPASDKKSVQQPRPPRVLKEGNGFYGTYYKGLRLTTNLQAVERAPGENDRLKWQLALVLLDTPSKQEKKRKKK